MITAARKASLALRLHGSVDARAGPSPALRGVRARALCRRGACGALDFAPARARAAVLGLRLLPFGSRPLPLPLFCRAPLAGQRRRAFARPSLPLLRGRSHLRGEESGLEDQPLLRLNDDAGPPRLALRRLAGRLCTDA